MTAEIAILNKTAVALAADSAVTISTGSDQQKVFDSEDKLFELSRHDPIGIMINSNMHFMRAPLPVLIKKYRTTCGRFKRVEEAADSFLTSLQNFGATSPPLEKMASLRSALEPVWAIVRDRNSEKFSDRLSSPITDDIPDFPKYFSELREKVLSEQIAAVRRAIETCPETQVIGDNGHVVDDIANIVNGLNDEYFSDLGQRQIEELHDLARLVLGRRVRWSPHTGMVFAGFGSDDLFPTLISFEVFGMVGNQLRIYRTYHVDVDRGGTRAKVIPFAQKEMVERFLYGLDDEIERKISDFCRQSVPSIREATMQNLIMEEGDRAAMEGDILHAETVFLDDLRQQTFDVIRAQSEAEIEDMVEFMPKSEMARMAEALVNLTSIKRRVSRGMETVGGPIDCAVISQADGFVWVNRKHYFSRELNNRYFDRMREQISKPEEA